MICCKGGYASRLRGRDAMKVTTQGFEARYHVEQLNAPPREGVQEFRKARLRHTTGELILETSPESLLLEITPVDGEPWVGSFECGPSGATGLYATPHPDVLCVVAKGQGFWVHVHAAPNFEIIRAVPIKEVHPVPGRNMLVFVDFTKLAGYGADGLLWQTDDLSWDGLKISEVSADVIRGLAWDSPANRDVPFSVDVETGASTGGASPAKRGTGRIRNQ